MGFSPLLIEVQAQSAVVCAKNNTDVLRHR